ncbi:hypothetical protein LRP52_48020 [Photobacterium sp. ZSDE20]|uniref:Uncharacterized protein n=1 Tax=Photobacterium pectinilyticum TaxID=2906793 RepID=A0ABT1N990_9GAMM|nr:hypothetical protein [Photobacterium sp. ZSDE20]MCQ1061315.1 hypothetical protein [Photobacterium sp. ZSDE20]MDD1829890.1 hypothetical protein [Photobacterium sp. ZSDE20]
MRIYTPSGWAILHFINDDQEFYKILGTWWGGFDHRDYWRLSSGSNEINFHIDKVTGMLISDQFCGSRYVISKHGYQRHNAFGRSFIQSLFDSLQSNSKGKITLCKLATKHGAVTWPIEVIDEVLTLDEYFAS